MTIQMLARAYRGDHELERLGQFLCEVNGLVPPHTYWHLGDLLWNTCFSTEAERQRHIRIWEADGTLQGFAWFGPPNNVACFVHPMLRGQGTLELPMFSWAIEHAHLFPQADDARLWTTALETDLSYIAYLSAYGFERGDMSSLRMVQELDRTMPKVQLPAGWNIRLVGDQEEWPKRVELHREVWHPSSVTLESYRRLRSSPVFIPELDLVSVAPDGTFASYCGGWLDRQNGIGLFEPVGTSSAYRRQGLSTAVLREGMRRMQALGARSVWISTGASNQEAASLYRTLGFRSTAEYRYGKRLP